MPLLGSPDSMVDACTQTNVLTHLFFAPFIDCKKSIVTVEVIFAKKELRELMKEWEASRQVHPPWVELTPDDDFSWALTEADQYLHSATGGLFGPITKNKAGS